MTQRFEVIFLTEALSFISSLDDKTRDKIIYNVDKSKVLNDPKLFKKLDDEIWEFRTEYRNLQYRFFAFWDKSDNQETLVLATHGIIKKTDKVSRIDIEKAKSIMDLYFKQKLGKE
jgi:phage-related protein